MITAATLRAAGRAVLTLAVVAVAASPALALEPINKDRKGLALHGYDAVAYFTDRGPVVGSAEFSLEWRGATWRFASAAHREMFAADPDRYSPQYGGYCAKAVAENDTADVDPEAWKIVDGKLYLNYSPRVQSIWERDIPGRIARADANWPGLVGGESN